MLNVRINGIKKTDYFQDWCWILTVQIFNEKTFLISIAWNLIFFAVLLQKINMRFKKKKNPVLSNIFRDIKYF